VRGDTRHENAPTSITCRLTPALCASWWYWKECGIVPFNNWLFCKGAVELWEPRGDVFPDGFNFTVPYPLVLHNRYFSANNNSYMKDLGFAAS
jgi:hypothetical protein